MYSVPVGGRCLCALALISDTASWHEEVRATAHAVAAIVATQIRHANDLATLAERQALTRALINGAPIAILAMDAVGRLVEFNPAAENLSGYRRDEVLGQPMSEFLVPERDRPRFLEHIQTYVTTGDPEEFTGQLRISTLHADGTERTTELTPVQITIGGEPVFTGFLRDLSEIERSHAALADQTERLNCLIASAMPGILITDEQGTVTNISQSFGAMFGIEEPAGLVGTSARSVMRRIGHVFVDPAAFERRVAEVARARQPMTGELMPCTDGRILECDYWPVLVDGRYRGDMWLAWDTSERAGLEQQRQQMLEAELAARRLAEQAQQPTRRAERAAAQDRRGQEPVPGHRVARAAHAADLDRLLQRADQGRSRGAHGGRRPLPRNHRAQRQPAAPARRRPADAGPARGRRAAAGPGPGLDRRPGRRGGQVGVGRRRQARRRHRRHDRRRARPWRGTTGG